MGAGHGKQNQSASNRALAEEYVNSVGDARQLSDGFVAGSAVLGIQLRTAPSCVHNVSHHSAEDSFNESSSTTQSLAESGNEATEVEDGSNGEDSDTTVELDSDAVHREQAIADTGSGIGSSAFREATAQPVLGLQPDCSIGAPTTPIECRLAIKSDCQLAGKAAAMEAPLGFPASVLEEQVALQEPQAIGACGDDPCSMEGALDGQNLYPLERVMGSSHPHPVDGAMCGEKHQRMLHQPEQDNLADSGFAVPPLKKQVSFAEPECTIVAGEDGVTGSDGRAEGGEPTGDEEEDQDQSDVHSVEESEEGSEEENRSKGGESKDNVESGEDGSEDSGEEESEGEGEEE
eukprot:1532562-Pleurochrysis_carterae.AAC.2